MVLLVKKIGYRIYLTRFLSRRAFSIKVVLVDHSAAWHCHFWSDAGGLATLTV